jgi:lysophospholipase L1-like esterase
VKQNMSSKKKNLLVSTLLAMLVAGFVFLIYDLKQEYNRKLQILAPIPISESSNALINKAENDLYDQIRAKEFIRTLIVGDSIGQGTGAQNAGEKWFARLTTSLANEYNVTNFITNLSRGGASVLGGWTDYNIIKTSIKDKYDLAFICFGQNDQGVLPIEIYSNIYERLIKQIKEEKGNPEIFLIIENGVGTKGYPEVMMNLAKQYDLNIIDTRQAFKQSGYSDEVLTIDKTRPSSIGQELYYNNIMDTIHLNLQQNKNVSYSTTSEPLFVRSNDYKIFSFTNTYTNINGFSSAKGNSIGFVKGNNLETTVQGNSIGLMLMQTPTGGKFDIYVDGNFIKELDNYCPFPNINTFIIGDQFSKGPHKVRIQINGNKSVESKDTEVEIAGFVSNQNV